MAFTTEDQVSASYNGGMDMKVGLGNAFTFDMTLIPDFGQVVTDALVLNLSPFELRLPRIGNSSRREPNYSTKQEHFIRGAWAKEGRFLNATKISGTDP